MLRLSALLLLVANGVFFAWSNGYLSPWGFASASKNESFRVNEQIEPGRIVIRQKDAAATAPNIVEKTNVAAIAPTVVATTPTAAVATACLTAGAFNDRQSTALMQVLSTKLPELLWRFDTVTVPARWIVYMGKYPNDHARDLKKKQLDQIKNFAASGVSAASASIAAVSDCCRYQSRIC